MREVMRSCLHCALARALGDEADELLRRRVVVTFSRSEAVWLPIPGSRIYRGIRRLLRHEQPRKRHGRNDADYRDDDQ